jgi:phage head maturation protease
MRPDVGAFCFQEADMPWDVFERDDEWCVYRVNDAKEAVGDSLGCHPTRAEAQKQVAALYANEPEAGEKKSVVLAGDGTRYIVSADPLDDILAVKALGQNRLGGYLVLWGDVNKKDLSGEYFDQRTEGLTHIFGVVGRVPMLYAHGKDDDLEFSPVGTYDVMVPDEVGLWAEGELNKANQYRDAIRQLVARGALGQSSQTLVSARKVSDDGHIDRWVIAEGSLTPTPCEPRMMDRPVSEIKAAYKALSLEFPEPDEEPETKGDEESRQRDRELALEAERLALLDL